MESCDLRGGPAPLPEQPEEVRWQLAVLVFLFAVSLLAVARFVSVRNSRPAPEPTFPVRDRMDENADAGKAFERLVILSLPFAKDFLERVTIDAIDRHLVVYLRPEYQRASHDENARFDKALSATWRDSRYVRIDSFNPAVEIIERLPIGEVRRYAPSTNP
jgi:hypothetical protein